MNLAVTPDFARADHLRPFDLPPQGRADDCSRLSALRQYDLRFESSRGIERPRSSSRRDQADMARAIETAGMRPVIGHSFPPAKTGAAFRRLDVSGHVGTIAIAT
jgi:hypothetical protein